MDESAFDATVSDFYRAATGVISWDQPLSRIQIAFSARTVFMHTADSRDGRVLSIRHAGTPSHERALEYVREFQRDDPRRAALFSGAASKAGKWWHCHDHFDKDYVEGHRFYQEFLPAYDARYTSAVVLAPGDEGEPEMTCFALELSKTRGVLSGDERELARRLGEHLGHALRTQRRMRKLMSQALAGHVLLESFAYPMWLLDEQCFIGFQNAAAARETASEVRAARRNHRLVLTRSQPDHRLREAMRALGVCSHGANTVVDLRASAVDPPTWLHLSLLIPSATLGAFGDQPQVLATLFDPSLVSPLDPFALMNIFGFTPVEARVAIGLADGFTAEQIASKHGTTINTVRSQIRQVLSKLGVRSVVDAARILRQGEVLWASAGKPVSQSAASLPDGN